MHDDIEPVMNDASLSELRQIFTDGIGIAINQFGAAQKKIDTVSPEIQQLDTESHALNALVSDYSIALESYTPEKAVLASKSFISRQFAAEQLIQVGIISLNQHLKQGLRDIQLQQQKMMNSLGNIDRIKATHLQEVDRLQATITHGKHLLHLAGQHADEFGSEQVNRFSRRINTLEQLLTSHQMSVLQINNTKSYAQDVLQNAKIFSEVSSRVWQQHIDFNGQPYYLEQLPHLERQVQIADNKRFSQQKVSRLIWPIIAAAILLYIVTRFLSSIAPTQLQSIDQPIHSPQYHSLNYEQYLNAQHVLLKQGNHRNQASVQQVDTVKQGLQAVKAATQSGEFKAPATVRLPMEYFVYGAAHSADLKRWVTLTEYAALLSQLLMILFCLYKLLKFTLNRALYPVISRRKQQLLAPLLKVTPKVKKTGRFPLIEDLKSILSDFKGIFK